MSHILRFEIPGPPIPKARARVSNGHAFTPERTRKYEKLVAAHARVAVLGMRGVWPADARYSFTARIYWPDARRRDLDNGIKSLTDSCLKIVYEDDSQIVELHGFAAIDRNRPRAEVEVRVVEVEAA